MQPILDTLSGLAHGTTAPFSGPLAASLTVLLACIGLCWLLQSVTRNYSWVDRLWSILPAVYALIYAGYGGSARQWLMAALATAWAVRLTWNFARKGGFHPKEEDYRWAYVRGWLERHDPLHPLGRELFSLLFIAVYQLVLIGLFVIPAADLVDRAPSPLGPLDALLGGLFLAFLVGESVADQQQWSFQKEKHALGAEARARRGGDYARGFLTGGLFRYSRHPNFLCEMGLWWTFAAFVLAAGAPAWWPAVVGPALLTALFQGSTNMTEGISAAKYPDYRRYQQTTSRLLPWRPGAPL